MELKTFVARVPEAAIRTEKKVTWVGHLVECSDLDSGDVFAVELMMNDRLSQDRLIDACYKSAAKHELVQLSGNSFEYEYLGRSGRIVEMEEYIFRTETHSRTQESEEMINNYQPG